MNFDALPALALFAFAGSITPGPNNLMLMASGANYGFRRTLPHMAGISIGFMVMMILAGLGMVELFDRFPVSYIILKTLSIGYMLYLVWKIATAAPATAETTTGRPMTFLQAAAFQWVNPKAWAMALTVITVYLGKPDPDQPQTSTYFQLDDGHAFGCLSLSTFADGLTPHCKARQHPPYKASAKAE